MAPKAFFLNNLHTLKLTKINQINQINRFEQKNVFSSPESNGSKNVSKKKTTFAVEEKKLRELLNDENEIEGDHGQSRKH